MGSAEPVASASKDGRDVAKAIARLHWGLAAATLLLFAIFALVAGVGPVS